MMVIVVWNVVVEQAQGVMPLDMERLVGANRVGRWTKDEMWRQASTDHSISGIVRGSTYLTV